MNEANFHLHVFINGPFDRKYLRKFQAIVFTVMDCGYWPRCSLEDVGSDITRVQNLHQMIGTSQYGVSDISRVELTDECPRFNMPYEAGLFHGSIIYGEQRALPRRMLVMDSEPYRYQKTLSDLAGSDVYAHRNLVKNVVTGVREWLRSCSANPAIPAARDIHTRFMGFLGDLPLLLEEAGFDPRKPIGIESYLDFREFVLRWLKENDRRKV